MSGCFHSLTPRVSRWWKLMVPTVATPAPPSATPTTPGTVTPCGNRTGDKSWYKDVSNPSNRLQAEMYKKLRNKGVYVNQPDTYFFQVKRKESVNISSSISIFKCFREGTRLVWDITRASSLCPGGRICQSPGKLCLTLHGPGDCPRDQVSQ